MAETGYYLPADTPKSWVADCEHVGSGDAALTYLARYLYRSVISEQNILRINNGKITFFYSMSYRKVFGGRATMVFYMVMPRQRCNGCS